MRVIQSAKAHTAIQDAALQEVAKLKEALNQEREQIRLERQAFQEEVGLFRKVMKQIYDRMTNLEKMEIAPFLSAFDRAKEAVLSVRDRFTSSKNAQTAKPPT